MASIKIVYNVIFTRFGMFTIKVNKILNWLYIFIDSIQILNFNKIILIWLLCYILYNICVYILSYTIMIESNNLTYDAWKEYLKSDKEMNSKWKSLTELWENIKKDLKENLNSLPYSEALRRRKFLTAKNIFNVINTAREKPNFAWDRKLIYNEEDERDEYVIQCKNPSSDYIFRRIKEERGVTNMHGESINKYLQPVADKIWALKETLRVSIQTETKPSDLSYEAMKTDIYEDEKEVDPDYPKTPEGWSGPTDPRVKWPIYQTEEESWESRKKNDNLNNNQETIIRDENWNLRRTTDGQYLLDFGE